MIQIYRIPTEVKGRSVVISPIYFIPKENEVYLLIDTIENKKLLIEAKIFNNLTENNCCLKCFLKRYSNDTKKEITMCKVNCYEYLKDKFYYFERVSKYQELFLGIGDKDECNI